MTHLTEHQVQQFVDGTADYMTQAACTNHLATCARCRREVEFQKTVLRTARGTGSVMPSRSFTRRVMARIAPSRASRAGNWVLNNMGAMFGMMAVLGLTGSVILTSGDDASMTLTLPSFDLSQTSERALDAWSGFSGAVEGLLGLIHVPAVSGELQMLLILGSVGALLVLDKMLMRTTRKQASGSRG